MRVPPEALSQVVFIHDYLQLVFQGDRLSIYNDASVRVGQTTLRSGEHGFCDALVSLIGSRALGFTTSPTESLVLLFEDGAHLGIAAAGHGPEAFQYTVGGQTFVEQNA